MILLKCICYIASDVNMIKFEMDLNETAMRYFEIPFHNLPRGESCLPKPLLQPHSSEPVSMNSKHLGLWMSVWDSVRHRTKVLYYIVLCYIVLRYKLIVVGLCKFLRNLTEFILKHSMLPTYFSIRLVALRINMS